MKYLLLAYADARWRDAMSTSERDAYEAACQANDEMLRKGGHLLAVESLHSSDAATTVRVQNGNVSVGDSALGKMQEQLVGLLIIQARDLNEAIRVAEKMPQARSGVIEVRSIIEFGQR